MAATFQGFARVGFVLKVLAGWPDPGVWVEPGRVLACAYPRREAALAGLAVQGVSLLINLHERPHEPGRLERHALVELHLPVKDFSPPAPEQIERGVQAIADAVAAGRRVAVHCGGGLGRTGTLLACYLITKGLAPTAAIARVRIARPGSVETGEQEAAVHAFARRWADGSPWGPS
jgi:atypical dual specificity phosphatase